jgi:hypothetical protein
VFTNKRSCDVSVLVSFIGGGNEYPEKTTGLPQVTDKLYYIMMCNLA